MGAIQTQYDKMAAYLIRRDGEIKVGVADVTLPKISYMTDTISGAGIAGEVETPTIGHLGSIEFGVTWRTINADLINMAAPVIHNIEFRGAQQVINPGDELFTVEPIRIVVRGIPKEVDLGKGQIASKTDSENTLEVIYLKVEVNDKTELEFDKFNYICNIGGTDYYQLIREALGI